jgi:hypothetical protein
MSNRSSSRAKVEKYPLPTTVDGICSLIREILAAGSVQRIELDVQNPVRVIRSTDNTEGADLEEDSLDLEGVLRNIEMVEYTSGSASPFQVVFDMMQLVHKERLNSVCWVSGSGCEKTLDEWLELKRRGMPVELGKLMGLPVHQVKFLSDDTLILCASPYPSAEFDELSLAIKTAVEIRRPSHGNQRASSGSETNDSIRSDPGSDSTPTNKLASSPRGLRRVDWKPSSKP